MKFAVVKSGGRQFVVHENEEILVDLIDAKVKDEIKLDTLLISTDADKITIGTPLVDSQVKATVIEHVKGDKVRTMRFKSKTRSRRIKGFRAQLTRIKITVI